MQKYTEEEILEMQEEIPEWKRTSLVVNSEEEATEEKKGVFKKIWGKASSKVGSTSFVKNISKSEEYKKWKKEYREMKDDLSEAKENLKDEVE